MYVIGVTGAIASGKSEVTRMLGSLGAWVIHADEIGHDVLRRADVQAAIHARWGDRVFRRPDRGSATGANSSADDLDAEVWGDRGGEVDRAALAQLVFAPPPDGPRELAYLESLTHPWIGREMTRLLEQYRAAQVPAVVLDAPVLYKAGWDALCDRIIFVDAPAAICQARAARRGWSPAELAARQQRQPDLEDQRRRADVVLDNGGSLAELSRQVEAFWGRLIPSADGPSDAASEVPPRGGRAVPTPPRRERTPGPTNFGQRGPSPNRGNPDNEG